MIPAASLRTYDAARHGVALVDRSDRARIVVSGTERASYLQGLLTNDILALRKGSGCYAVYLTPQGRMITDLWVYELGDVILLSFDGALKDIMLAKLDQLVFAEDVQLGDVTATFGSVALVGPESPTVASRLLSHATAEMLAALPEHGNVRAEFSGQPAIVLRITDPGESGLEILFDASVSAAMHSALDECGVARVDDGTAEALRIEAGIPKFHRDMDEDTIPLEAGIEERAVSFSKGCYVGQEVIVRVLHRGHGRVARKLVGLTLAGADVPDQGTPVYDDSREIGHVTSSVLSPALNRPIALAYVHRDYLEPGTHVTVGGSQAVVTALPFVRKA